MEFLNIFQYIINLNLTLLIPYSLAFIVMLISSITDLKTREVPDWINLGLIGAGIAINLLFSIIYWNLGYIINSLIGFAALFIIALIMFYTGQWGGGDSKMLMGLGALIGINIFQLTLNTFLLAFLINILLIGALYGMLWSFYLIYKNRKKFVLNFKKINKSKKVNYSKKIILVLFFVFILLAIIVQETYLRLIFLYVSVIIVITFYLWAAIKSVENSCMLKYVTPDKLTEGDWIAKEVKVNGKYITGPKDLGIEKKQIRKLVSLYKKKKVKKILIKEGIPFVPSFFIAYLVTLMFGNLLLLFV